MELVSRSIQDNDKAAEWFVERFQDPSIVLMVGEMGAGKTTLMKSLCKALGSSDEVSSPTFSLVNEYTCPSGKIFHFDLYRLKKSSELLDMGFEEYIDSGHWCFIEWPDLAMEILPKRSIVFSIVTEGDTRKIKIQET
jgi:tRNA threonylcarbamoyladenosine biosynthesis protein TsaE